MVTISKDKSNCVLPRRKVGLKMSVKYKGEDYFRFLLLCDSHCLVLGWIILSVLFNIGQTLKFLLIFSEF